MESQFRIATAQPTDAAAMAALHAVALPSHWSEAEFTRTLLTPKTTALTARTEKGELAGFILLRGAAGEAEILTLAVDEKFRRSGLATALTERALGEAKGAGAAEVFLEVGALNHPAQALYEALGFRKTAIRQGYYRPKQGLPIDALVMRRALT